MMTFAAVLIPVVQGMAYAVSAYSIIYRTMRFPVVFFQPMQKKPTIGQ